MKKITIGLLLCASITNVNAKNFSTIVDNIYETEDIVRDSQRKLNRRPKLAKKVNAVILKAQKDIEALLTKRGGNGGAIDLKLVKVAQNACSNLGTWSGRKDCFSNYLSGTRGILGSLQNACSALTRDQSSANCYTKGLTAISSGERKKSKIANKSCSTLGHWDSRKECFSDFLAGASNDSNKIAHAACSNISKDQASANCFTLATSLKGDEEPEALLIKACSTLGFWDARATCFVNGVNKADNLGYGLKRYTRGCFSTSGDQAQSQCFDRSLRSL